MFRNSMSTSQSLIPGPPCPSRSASAAVALAPSLSPPCDYESLTLPMNLAPPTLSQLRDLTFLPTALLSAGSSVVGGKGRRKADVTRRKVRLAREGQIVSKAFDAFGSLRPQPTNGLSLEQSVTLELEVVIPNFILSSATAGLPSFAALTTQLSQFSGATNLISVFDQYRIEQIETWLDFSAPNGTLPQPFLYSAVDLDDANVPTNVGQVQDHMGAIVAGGPAGHYHKWRPHIAIASFSGAFTSYSNAPASWIDSASPNVQHYGLKVATLSNGGQFAVGLTTRVVVTFRAPSIN